MGNLTSEDLLKEYWGHDEFRMAQKNIIENINSNESTLGIMPTGGGKSVCYQIPAIMKDGLTVVISPIKSLMDDQVKGMTKIGLSSATLNSGTEMNEKETIYNDINNENLKVLLISPERAVNTINYLNSRKIKISQYVFDEAHCISQWGHDFRPDYKKAAAKILASEIPILALTATADNRTKADVQEQLNIADDNTFVSGFNRPNIHLSAVYKKGNGYDQVKAVLMNRQGESGIIFCATKNEANKLHKNLKVDGLSVGKYHADMTDLQRKKSQLNFIEGKVQVMVATTAFGMGIDKADIRYTLHSSMPYSVANYAQEFGRCGRDGKEAEAMIFYKYSDINGTLKYMEDNNAWDRHEKYKEVVDIVTSKDCLRTKISKKFGEELEEDCSKCSSCDATSMGIESHLNLDANKFGKDFLIAINEYRLSLNATVELLAGSKTVNVRAFKKSPLYGSYSKDDKRKNIVLEDLKQMANELVYSGYIDMKSTSRDHGFVHVISQMGKDVVNGKAETNITLPNYQLPHEVDKKQVTRVNRSKETTVVKAPRRKRAVRSVIATPRPIDTSKITNIDLFNNLMEKRNTIASLLKINEKESFKVIPNQTLVAISEAMPESRKDLEDIKGVGKDISRKHSHWIMGMIKDFKENENSLEM